MISKSAWLNPPSLFPSRLQPWKKIGSFSHENLGFLQVVQTLTGFLGGGNGGGGGHQLDPCVHGLGEGEGGGCGDGDGDGDGAAQTPLNRPTSDIAELFEVFSQQTFL